jgi:uncharacterized protein YciI
VAAPGVKSLPDWAIGRTKSDFVALGGSSRGYALKIKPTLILSRRQYDQHFGTLAARGLTNESRTAINRAVLGEEVVRSRPAPGRKKTKPTESQDIIQARSDAKAALAEQKALDAANRRALVTDLRRLAKSALKTGVPQRLSLPDAATIITASAWIDKHHKALDPAGNLRARAVWQMPAPDGDIADWGSTPTYPLSTTSLAILMTDELQAAQDRMGSDPRNAVGYWLEFRPITKK